VVFIVDDVIRLLIVGVVLVVPRVCNCYSVGGVVGD